MPTQPISCMKTRKDVRVYLTAAQVEDVDKKRANEGLSRSAFVRSRFIKQLRWENYLEWKRISGGKKRLKKANVPPASTPPKFVGGTESEPLIQAALQSIEKEPWEKTRRIHAAHAMKSLGLGFSSETAKAMEPIVDEARRRFNARNTGTKDDKKNG